MKKIMFVCTGNICRSAMACGYMQKKVIDIGKESEYIIDSCGIYAMTGDKSTNDAVEAMKNYDVDLSKHRAKNIDDTNIQDFDMILCMTKNHKESVIYLYPFLKEKTFTLKEYVKNDDISIDINDPWGTNLSVYIGCAKEIVECIDMILEK